jgi:succinate dehydrogenase (ubiquinone) cytochrome b560 subunit
MIRINQNFGFVRLFSSTQPAPQFNRPISPHIFIYQPQLTWLMSIAHRMTGAATAAGFYTLLITYGLFGPKGSVGNLQLVKNTSKFISDTPLPLVVTGKALIAAPLCFHFWNGIRHLIWDTGVALSLRGVYSTGWAVNIATIFCTGYFSFFK